MGNHFGRLGVDLETCRGRDAAEQVARDLGIRRSTVARAVTSTSPPKHERLEHPTSFSPFEPRVRALLREVWCSVAVFCERFVSSVLVSSWWILRTRFF